MKVKRKRKQPVVNAQVSAEQHAWLKRQAEAETRTIAAILARAVAAERAKIEQQSEAA